MKTIIIPLFSGVEGKNIFRSDIFAELAKNPEHRIVFMVKSPERAEYYKRENSGAKVVFEVIPDRRPEGPDRFFSFLKYYLLRSKTIDLKRRARLEREGGRRKYFFSFLANRFLARRTVRRIIRFLDQRLVRTPDFIQRIFDNHRPAAVFLADLFDDTEAAVLREARRRKILSIGFVSTWDRVTSRWMVRLLPDEMIIFNEVMKKEVMEFVDMPERRIRVSGAVQHDFLINLVADSKEEFFAELGIPLNHKLIVLGPLGQSFDPTKRVDLDLIDILHGFISAKKIAGGKAFVVVRFPPNDFIEEERLKKYPAFYYDIPGVRFSKKRGQDWDMTPDDFRHLKNLLTHADVVICFYSSLSVDAAVCDKPVINVDFYPAWPGRHPYYQTTHYSKVAAIGGIWLVKSKEELLQAINTYLENPELHADRRAEVARQQSWRPDGRSGKRVADIIEKLLY